MRKIFEIDRDRLLALVRRELEISQGSQRSIDNATQHFLANPYNAEGFLFYHITPSIP